MNYAQQVDDLIRSCLFTDEEIAAAPNGTPERFIQIKGIVGAYGLHPERLAGIREKLVTLIKEIVDDHFLKGEGEGWTFLNLCTTRDGELWAEQPTMDDFIALCRPFKLAGWCAPRSVWDSMPGGVPYVWFDPNSTQMLPEDATD